MNKISLPATLKVGGFDYALDLDHNHEMKADGCYGQCSEILRRITIDSTCSEQQFSQTFIHELLHSIDSIYGHNTINEEQNSALSQGLFQVLESLGVRFVKGGEDEKVPKKLSKVRGAA